MRQFVIKKGVVGMTTGSSKKAENQEIIAGPSLFDLLVSLGHEDRSFPDPVSTGAPHVVVFKIKTVVPSEFGVQGYEKFEYASVVITAMKRKIGNLTHWQIEGSAQSLWRSNEHKPVQIEYFTTSRTGRIAVVEE